MYKSTATDREEKICSMVPTIDVGIASCFAAYSVAVVGYYTADFLVGCPTVYDVAACFSDYTTNFGCCCCVAGDYYCSRIRNYQVHGILFYPGFLC